MEDKTWVNFWTEYGRQSRDKDAQTQVLRTINKQPITEERWQECLEYLDRQLEISPEDEVLDLCCGNGLIAQHFAGTCRSVTAVDISRDLLDGIDTARYPNVRPICQDIRTLEFAPDSFSKIVLYAGVQYLNYKETVLLFEKVKQWLRPGGIFFVGDIPDAGKLWVFFNSPERRAVYFNTVKEERDIVGTWFDREWLGHLSGYAGFSESQIMDQQEGMIYAFFRYDMKIRK